MLNRRHIRVKVMQTIYSMHKHQSDDLIKQEKFLLQSIEKMKDLYLLMTSALIELRKKEVHLLELGSKKHLATAEDKNPNNKFIDNKVLKLLTVHEGLQVEFETRKIDQWQRNDDLIVHLLTQVKESELYANYMSSTETSFTEDKKFCASLFEQIIAPDDKLYDYLEDYSLTWVDDIPTVNTLLVKQLRKLKVDGDEFEVSKLYKDSEDKDFVSQLYRKTVLNEDKLLKEFEDKTPNWDTERIAEIDTIVLKMAICELLHFPSIPTKVTINEYLEIVKEYSTAKSSIFINGILDKLVKEFQQDNRLNKVGRGLM